MIKRKSGIALPLIVTFLFCLIALTAALVFSRKESKMQNLANVHFLKANFLAQSAIQMVMLKLKLFPQDLSDAGVFSLGYCPFRGLLAAESYQQQQNLSDICAKPLSDFVADCNTASFSWRLNDSGNSANNDGTANADYSFEIKSLKVTSVFTDVATQELVLTLQITALGKARFAKGAKKGQDSIRIEEMVKTVILRRKLV